MWYTIEASVCDYQIVSWLKMILSVYASSYWHDCILFMVHRVRPESQWRIPHCSRCTYWLSVCFLLAHLQFNKKFKFQFSCGILHFLEGFTLLYLPFFTYLLKVTSESLLSNPLKTIKQLFLFIAFIWKQFLMDDGTLPFNSWLRKRQFLIFKICLSRIRICAIANEHI